MTVPVEPDPLAAARAWAAGDPDPVTRAELEALIAAGDHASVATCMMGPLVFGTAGLRARVGPGNARMNRATVIRTTRGLADFLAARRDGARSLPVVVGHDARTTSPELAREVVAVLAGARVPVRFFEEPVPTPLVAYAARTLGATAAVVVTASHNPRDDNGYKVYLDDAIQLVAPNDELIQAAIERVGPAASVPRAALGSPGVDALPIPLGPLFERYLTETFGRLGIGTPRSDPLRIVYTPLHGVGLRFAKEALRRAGFENVTAVPEQAEPDGNFPTTPFPNPEEPGTLDLALALAARDGAELVLANDPDADRLAAGVPTPSGRVVALTGNQLAVLLTDAALTAFPGPGQPLVTASVVTTPLVEAVARARGARFERTLTGFKWLWTAALALERAGVGRFACACEEALGYSVTPAVRDKDGIAAAVLLAFEASRCRERGETLLDRFHALCRAHGLWASAQVTVPLQGSATNALTSLDRLASSPPRTLGGREVTEVVDYRTGAEARPRWLGVAPLLELRVEGGRVLVRPSGTEPKLKIYVDLSVEVGEREAVGPVEASLTETARTVGNSVLTILSDAASR
jgi:phosphomannomutase